MPRPAGLRAASAVLAAWAALAPAAVAGEFLPSLHNVTGVAVDDVLNVRLEPSAQAEIVAVLPPDARGIEVTAWSPDGAWARVNVAEHAGWVARRFLAAAEGPEWFEPGARLRCYGTEPFWNLDLGAVVGFNDPERAAALPLSVSGRARSAGLPGVLGLSLGRGFATIRAADCNDGMSNREMGLAIDLFLEEGGVLAGYSGCCSLAP